MILRDAVNSEGYAIIPDAIEIDKLAAVADDLVRGDDKRSRAGIRHAMRFESVTQIARNPKIIGIAQEILGGDAVPFRATIFDKSPQSNWLVVWHQDTALPLKQRHYLPGWESWSMKDGVNYGHAPAEVLEQIIAVRIHLDDSRLGNGPLRVLPRTHVLGLLSDEQIQHLAREREVVNCTVVAGGLVAMRPLLLHASSKSQTDAPRRVLHVEYARSHVLGDGSELAVC